MSKSKSVPQTRNRPQICVTLRKDLHPIAAKVFEHTLYQSAGRFFDEKLVEFAKTKKPLLKKLGIPMPKDEVTA